MKDILEEGDKIDSEESFRNDLNLDGRDEIIKYYTLANNSEGCMYVRSGIIVYENTKISVVESIYEPSYAFELTGIVNGKITVSRLDFAENDICYPTIPTKGILNLRNHQLFFRWFKITFCNCEKDSLRGLLLKKVLYLGIFI